MKPIEIMIAEDHRLFRQLLVNTFKEFDIETIAEAQNGTELLEFLKTRQPSVVLLDIEMPGMNGFKTLELMRELHPRVKVIVLTLHDSGHLQHYLYEKGATAFLNKNADTNYVVSIIRDVAAGSYKHHSKLLNKSEQFSLSEARLIPLMCAGKSNKAIARDLEICIKTVEAHKKSLFKKTHTGSAVECVSYFFKTGLNNLW